MCAVRHHTPEQMRAIADQIGAILAVEDAASKIAADGWSLEQWGDGHVLLRVEMGAVITPEQAESILNARPLPKGQDQ